MDVAIGMITYIVIVVVSAALSLWMFRVVVQRIATRTWPLALAAAFGLMFFSGFILMLVPLSWDASLILRGTVTLLAIIVGLLRGLVRRRYRQEQ